jgi:hypothetical protein
MKIPTWAKVGVGLGVLSVVAGGVAVVRSVRPFWQGGGDWGAQLLGDSSTTIAKAGCLLTLFTMASNALRGTNYTPGQVNAKLRAAGAFDAVAKANLWPDRAAAALGLRFGPRLSQDDRVKPTAAAIRALVDETLRKGGLAVLHVDHNGDGRGDHFVLINGRRADGSYTAADPAPGAIVPLSSSLSGPVQWGSATKNYTPVGAFALV